METEKKWEPNPELQDAIQKFYDRIRGMLSDELERLDKDFAKLKVFTQPLNREEIKKDQEC